MGSLEIGCDKNPNLIELWRALKEPWFLPAVCALEYSEKTFLEWKSHLPTDSKGVAIRELVTRRMSRGGLGTHFAWSTRTRGGKPGDLNAWETWVEELPKIQGRIKDVLFEAGDFRISIPRFSQRGAVIYCDPPYLKSTRTAKKAYGEFEMSRQDHLEFLELVRASKATVLVSGYMSKLYSVVLEDWELYTKEMPCNAGQGEEKERRVECLWVKRA